MPFAPPHSRVAQPFLVTLVLALVGASLCLVLSGGAEAQTRTVTDAKDDAVPALDIRSARFVFTSKKIRARIKMADIDSSSVQVNIYPGKKGKGNQFFLNELFIDKTGTRTARLAYAPPGEEYGEDVDCAGARITVTKSDVVRLSVPLKCLRAHTHVGRNIWVGAVAFGDDGLDAAPQTKHNKPAYVHVRRG
jgi:hypothetical protein